MIPYPSINAGFEEALMEGPAHPLGAAGGDFMDADVSLNQLLDDNM